MRKYLLLSTTIVAAACGDPAREASSEVGTASMQCAADSIPVRVGGANGLPQFSILGPAAIIQDTLVVVNDRMSRDFYVIGPSGGIRNSFGGQGQGPGEFDAVESIRVYGDSVAIYDSGNRRVTWYDASGTLLRTESAPAIWPARGWIGPFDDRYLGRAVPIRGSAQFEQVIRDTVVLTLYDAVAGDSVVLDTIPGTDRLASTRGGFSVFLLPFGRRLSYAAGADRLILSDGSTQFVSWRVSNGAQSGFTLPDRSRSVTSDLHELVSQSMAQGRAEEARALLVQQIPRPDRTPSYGAITGDELGHVWVPTYRAPGEVGTDYVVVDSSGRTVEHSTWSATFDVIAASAHLIVGQTIDEYDVPVLLLYSRTCTPR